MKPLDRATMQAAEVLLHHGEHLAVIYVKPSGVVMECRLSGRGDDPETALLTVWYAEELKHKAVPFARVLLPPGTEGRIASIARTQGRQSWIDSVEARRQKSAREAAAA